MMPVISLAFEDRVLELVMTWKSAGPATSLSGWGNRGSVRERVDSRSYNEKN